MSFLDRFKSKKGKTGDAQSKQPKHVVADAKQKAEEAKKRQFAAVPAAGAPAKSTRRDEGSKDSRPTESAPKRSKGETGDAYRILLRGVVSEKASLLAGRSQYIFMVQPQANKISIKRAISRLYGVTPLAVNIVNVRGKALRYGRTEGRTKDWKKAVVTLKSGDRIDVNA